MSKFVGVKYRVVKRILLDNGWQKIRHNGSHETWGKGDAKITIPNRPDGVNQMILRRLFKENNIYPIPK